MRSGEAGHGVADGEVAHTLAVDRRDGIAHLTGQEVISVASGLYRGRGLQGVVQL